MIRIKSFVCYVLLSALIVSCTREGNSGTQGNTPRLTGMISRSGGPGNFIEVRQRYEYDNNGRILRIVDLERNTPIESFEYSGDELMSMTTYDENGNVRVRYDRPLRISANRDTIVLSLIERVGATGTYDTLISSYIFRDSLVTAVTTYGRFGGSPDPPFQTATFYAHDIQKRLLRALMISGRNEETIWTVLERDNKRNINRIFTREQFVLLSEFEYSALAANNVTKIQDRNGDIIEFEWTYNSEGWPLTCKRKGRAFIDFEFQYN